MRLTKKLKEYLENRDFYNLFEIANTIADYKEWKHEDNREITDEIRELAERYVNEMEMYLEDEEWTWKWDENRIENWKDYLFDDLNNILFSKHSQLIDYIRKWLKDHNMSDDDAIVWTIAGEFIDRKELYDLDYED